MLLLNDLVTVTLTVAVDVTVPYVVLSDLLPAGESGAMLPTTAGVRW